MKRLCTVLHLSRSGFRRRLKGAPARAAKKAADAALTQRIGKVHPESGKTYGAKRITAGPRAGGVMVNRMRIERLMRQHGIQGRRLKRRHRTTILDPAALAAPDEREHQRAAAPVLPKGTDLARWSAEELEAVALAINDRPRKVLGWKTPAEVFAEQLRSIRQPGVATTD